MKTDGQSAEEATRIEAYLLSETAGHPAGMEAFFWSEAEVIVAGRATKAPPPKRYAAKAKAAPAAKRAPGKAAKKSS